MLRVVLDTNVLYSAVVSSGKPRLLLRLGIEGRFLPVTSDLLIQEFTRVMHEEESGDYRTATLEMLALLNRSCRKVKVRSNLVVAVKADPSDDAVVNTALDGRADYIVTGDRHLLELQKFRWIRIVTVGEMLKTLGC
jgi:putative PIN family toxin of toxin-antitoxin system